MHQVHFNMHSVQIYKDVFTCDDPAMYSYHSKQEGTREKKRRETHQRITEAALRLFMTNGYEATTLDAIAAEAGIARRTFFHYYRSKEEIILAWQRSLPETLYAAILRQDAKAPVFDTVRRGVMALASDMPPDVAIMMSRIVQSDAQLRASNQAKFVSMENAAFDALCVLRPDASERSRARIAAMIGVGALRLAVDEWSKGGGSRALLEYLSEMFSSMPRTWRQDLS